MSKLEELIKEFCPNGVEYKKIEELCAITTGKLNANAMVENGEYAFFTCDAKPFRIDTYAFDMEAILISGNGSQVGHINYYKGKFNAYQRTYVLYDFQFIEVKFLLYCLENRLRKYILLKSKKGSVPYITLPMLQEFKVPLPALPVQREIVRILDSFTLYSAELTAELTARRKQYEFYRDKLLNFNHVQYKEVALLELLCQSITDGPHETPVFVDSGIPFISAEAIHDTRIDFSKIRGFISSEYNEQCNKKYKPQINDVFMVKSGSTTGKVAMVTDSREFNIWSPIAAMRTNTSLLPRYLFYILQTKDIQNQVVKYASNGSQPNLSMRKLEQFKIKVPPIDVQERIVKVLDNFDAICSDLGIGLPAEIEKRQKQYEYYRDKLLTFEGKNNNGEK